MYMLPKWVLANPLPALHDLESLTVLDQTARIYGAMNALVTEYNKFAEETNKALKEFGEHDEEFELKITKVIREFMCCWEQKTADLNALAETIINEAIRSGNITVTEVYDPDKESLDLIVGGEV